MGRLQIIERIILERILREARLVPDFVRSKECKICTLNVHFHLTS